MRREEQAESAGGAAWRKFDALMRAVAAWRDTPLWLRIGLGAAAAAIGAFIHYAILVRLGASFVYVSYFPLVEMAALAGGFAAGGAAAVLSAFAAHAWSGLNSVADWLGLLIFLTGTLLICAITDALLRIWRRVSEYESRLRFDDELRAVNERLRLAISIGAIGTWDYDAATHVSTLSPEMCELFGFPLDLNATPDTIFDAIAPQDRPGAQAAFARALDPSGDGVCRTRYRIRRADTGEERWISSRAQAYFKNNLAMRLIGISRDITEEKAVERLLSEKARLAEQITSVAASVPGTICSFRKNSDGGFSLPFASRNFFSVYGLARSAVRDDASPLLARIHPDDAEHVRAGVAESERTMKLWRDEFRYEHPAKGTIWIEGQSSPVVETDGGIVWHGYIQDVTERKLAEKALKASEAKARAIFDSDLIGIVFWDASGKITDANDKFLQMTGYSREDLARGAIDWIKLTPEEQQHLDLAALNELRDTGVLSRPFEKEYIRKDGSRIPVLLGGAMLDEARVAGVAFVLDIIGRKEAEARAERLNAERMKTIESLAAGIAHEVNQPLAAAGVYMKTLRRLIGMAPEKRPISLEEAIDKADAQFTRAGQIITRLREFIAHGEPDMTRVSLHDVIRSACSFTGARADQLDIRLTMELNAPRDLVLADALQIEQVIVNLIRNAKDAMKDAQTRELVVSTSSTETEITVDIADTGGGMSEKVAQSLFEPFVTTKAANMGVGLAISRAIIAAHHGSITAVTKPGGRAVVSFTLPLTAPGAA